MNPIKSPFIPLRLKNKELLNSLIYQLNIKFREYKFTLGKEHSSVIHNCDDDKIVPLIEKHIQDFENDNIRMGNRIHSKILWSTDGHATFAEVSPPPSSVEKHPGLWIHFDEIAIIGKALSSTFASLVKQIGARDITLPRLISKSDLLKIGHLPKESHQIAFLTIPNQEDQEFALTPAVCLPCYTALENTKLKPPAIYTLEGTVHRYEGGVFSTNSLSRLREFRVREIIAFGDENEMQKMRDFFISTCRIFADTFEIPAAISTATDLFFHNEGSSQAFHQLVHESKLEFKIRFENMEMAAASYNNHGTHFTKTFNIGDDKLRSFCIGFGIDRLAYAIYCKRYSIEQINERLNYIKGIRDET